MKGSNTSFSSRPIKYIFRLPLTSDNVIFVEVCFFFVHHNYCGILFHCFHFLFCMDLIMGSHYIPQKKGAINYFFGENGFLLFWLIAITSDRREWRNWQTHWT